MPGRAPLGPVPPPARVGGCEGGTDRRSRGSSGAHGGPGYRLARKGQPRAAPRAALEGGRGDRGAGRAETARGQPPGGGVRGPTGNRAGAASCRMMLDRVSGAGGDPAASLRRVGHQMAGSCITSAPIWGAAPAPSNTKTPAVRHIRCWGPCVLARWVSRGHGYIVPLLLSDTMDSNVTDCVFLLQRVTKRVILMLVNNIGIVAWRCKHAQQLGKRYTD